MKLRIVADGESEATHVRRILKGLPDSTTCVESTDWSILELDQRPFAGFDGLLLVALKHLNPANLDQVRQLRSVLAPDASIVVVAKATDHSSILRAIRAGATDFLLDDPSLVLELELLINRLRNEGKRKEPQGKTSVIIPCGSPRDSGVLAVNLAAAMAMADAHCALLDLHLSGGDLALFLKLSPRHTISDLVTQENSLDQAVFEQALTTHESKIRLLAGPLAPLNASLLQSIVMKKVITFAQRLHSQVVISTDSIQHATQVLSLGSCETMLLVTHLDVVSLHRAKQHIDLLLERGVTSDQICIVALGAGQSGALGVTDAKRVLQVRTIHGIPFDREAEICSINVGNPFVIEFPRKPIAQAVIRLAEDIAHFRDTPIPAARATPLRNMAKEALGAISFSRREMPEHAR